MKNKKFKLFASLTSLVMVVAVMAVGVWAATGATVGVTSKVSFTATEGFIGTITGTITGAATGAVNNAEIATIDYTTGNATTPSWDIGELSFAAPNAAGVVASIVYQVELNVTALEAGKKVTAAVTMADGWAGSGTTFTNGNLKAVISNGEQLTSTGTITTTVTVTVANALVEISKADVNFNVAYTTANA